MVTDVAGAMAHVGMQPHGRASVFGANSPEWMIAMQVPPRLPARRPQAALSPRCPGWGDIQRLQLVSKSSGEGVHLWEIRAVGAGRAAGWALASPCPVL